MLDYLKIYEKFKDVKEVKDYIDDVILLRHYYATQQFAQMQDHIRKLTIEYPVEALTWNIVHPIMPNTYEQAYINAENFMQVQGAIIIAKKVTHYVQHLSEDEAKFVESMVKSKEQDQGGIK